MTTTDRVLTIVGRFAEAMTADLKRHNAKLEELNRRLMVQNPKQYLCYECRDTGVVETTDGTPDGFTHGFCMCESGRTAGLPDV